MASSPPAGLPGDPAQQHRQPGPMPPMMVLAPSPSQQHPGAMTAAYAQPPPPVMAPFYAQAQPAGFPPGLAKFAGSPSKPYYPGVVVPPWQQQQQQQQQHVLMQQQIMMQHPQAHDHASGGAGAQTVPDPAKYKTEMCQKFSQTGSCRYAESCQFAHGQAELRQVIRHPLFKTSACKSYENTGTCRYGNRCRFVHSESPQELQMIPRATAVVPEGYVIDPVVAPAVLTGVVLPNPAAVEGLVQQQQQPAMESAALADAGKDAGATSGPADPSLLDLLGPPSDLDLKSLPVSKSTVATIAGLPRNDVAEVASRAELTAPTPEPAPDAFFQPSYRSYSQPALARAGGDGASSQSPLLPPHQRAQVGSSGVLKGNSKSILGLASNWSTTTSPPTPAGGGPHRPPTSPVQSTDDLAGLAPPPAHPPGARYPIAATASMRKSASFGGPLLMASHPSGAQLPTASLSFTAFPSSPSSTSTPPPGRGPPRQQQQLGTTPILAAAPASAASFGSTASNAHQRLNFFRNLSETDLAKQQHQQKPRGGAAYPVGTSVTPPPPASTSMIGRAHSFANVSATLPSSSSGLLSSWREQQTAGGAQQQSSVGWSFSSEDLTLSGPVTTPGIGLSAQQRRDNGNPLLEEDDDEEDPSPDFLLDRVVPTDDDDAFTLGS